MNIDFKKGIINGVIIYAVVFVVVLALTAFGVETNSTIAQVAGWVAVAGSAYYLAQKAGLTDTSSALGYGVLTAVVVLALDYLITKRFNPDFDPTSTRMLIGYALIILAPVVSLQLGKK